jgi:glycerol-1-phosphate dehydrogenase [NAD(P)+]
MSAEGPSALANEGTRPLGGTSRSGARGSDTKRDTSGAGALDRLLRGEYLDPDGGAPIGVPIRAVRIERSLRDAEADLVAPLGLGRRLAVVSDPATRAVLGARLERALARLGTIVPVVLEAQPHADAQTVATLRRACASADALVAVGSGTINDLCKFAAAKDGKPYVVFATAPSMNGYTSMNAAITVDGHKKTLAAATPRAVFMDLEVLAAAPARMIRAGLGDSLCRPTAQVDWLLSRHLLGTPYRSAPFAMLEDDESVLLEAPEALLSGDLDAMRALARTLVLSGIGMTVCGGSYPASQGEHLISHCIDMFAPADRGIYFHGEQVAVATLTMARVQEAALAAGPPRLRASAITHEELRKRLGSDIGESCWLEFEPKRIDDETALSLSRRAADVWDDVAVEVRRASIPAARLESVLKRAGGPTTPEDIGLDPDFYAGAVRHARFLRDRYTFLDLADDSGLLARLWPIPSSTTWRSGTGD